MIEQIKALCRKILHANDTPHRIAWGVAVGMFVAWTPTIGFQMIIAGALAWLLRGNTAAAVAVVWITNPYTVVPIFWGNYMVGHWLVGGPSVDWQWFYRLIFPQSAMNWSEYVAYANARVLEIAGPMWCGSVVVGLVVALVSYYWAYRMVIRFRRFRHEEPLHGIPLLEPAAATVDTIEVNPGSGQSALPEGKPTSAASQF